MNHKIVKFSVNYLNQIYFLRLFEEVRMVDFSEQIIAKVCDLHEVKKVLSNYFSKIIFHRLKIIAEATWNNFLSWLREMKSFSFFLITFIYSSFSWDKIWYYLYFFVNCAWILRPCHFFVFREIWNIWKFRNRKTFPKQ